MSSTNNFVCVCTQVAMVVDVGGSSPEVAIRRMMRFLISNELAIQYNLFGCHGKKRFRDLRLLTKMAHHCDLDQIFGKWV